MWASMVLISLLGGVDASAGESRRLKKQAIALRSDCHEGHMDRCMDLADMTRHGHGMDVDKGGAAALYRQGCVEGRARGCMGLAELTLSGEVAGDRAESIENLRLTCANWDGSHETLQGLPYLEAQAVTAGCINLAHVFREKGKSSRAQQLYRKACARDALGCFSAAAMLPMDDEALAKKLTARACGMEKVEIAPTQIVSRVEMERGCHGLRMNGVFPDDLGLESVPSPAVDPRDGEKVPSVDFSTDVQVKKTGELKLEKEHALLPRVEATCRLHLVVDAKGKPYDVRVSRCPAEAQALVEDSGWRWRFEPVMTDDVPGRAQFEFDVDVEFGSEGASAPAVPEADPETSPSEEPSEPEGLEAEGPAESSDSEASGSDESPPEEAPNTEEPVPTEGEGEGEEAPKDE